MVSAYLNWIVVLKRHLPHQLDLGEALQLVPRLIGTCAAHGQTAQQGLVASFLVAQVVLEPATSARHADISPHVHSRAGGEAALTLKQAP